MLKTLSLSAALTIVASTAFAAPQCNDRDNVLDLLKNQYSEAPVAIGVANNGGLVEVLSTGDGDTWSIIITTPNGMSCLVAAGAGLVAGGRVGRRRALRAVAVAASPHAHRVASPGAVRTGCDRQAACVGHLGDGMGFQIRSPLTPRGAFSPLVPGMLARLHVFII